MAIFKCKMCGGTLEINNNETVAVCEYCGTKQTLPKLDDEKRIQLYDRANHFRRENEFDKAMGIYEMILSDDKEDCESYWGLVLCRYGIEYVEDPRTHKRIPTVNRAQFTSIFDDEDYKNAIKFADGYQKDVYEAEAGVIDKIQKGILEISNKEEPFDIFICYKETDKNGNRTQDSVYAQDIYTALTKEGYKVFFSRITLEDKLGSAYEPYIFAALNSANVMLVVGTEKDNFNAVWVKNEWSRYISLIKAGKDKTLIPVYKDITPYDMPEEFQYLQSQDMAKIGFMQDLVRGISKLVNVNSSIEKETVIVNSGNSQVEPLIKRIFMFLEDGDFARADEFCEQVLNLDPECADAYLGKLMAELRVKKQEELANCENPFDNMSNYHKVIRFADSPVAETIKGYVKQIENRNEDIRKDRIYNDAIKKMEVNSIESLKSAIEIFSGIHSWKDSQEQILLCKQKIEEIEIQKEQERLEQEKQLEQHRLEKQKRIKRNKKIAVIATPIVCVLVVFVFLLNTVFIPNSKYNNALDLIVENKYSEAISVFAELDGYKDSEAKMLECYYLIATQFFNEENFNDAVNAYKKADQYSDSKVKLSECYYHLAVNYLNNENIEDAAINFGKAGEYRDAKEQSMILWNKIAVRETIAADSLHTVGVKKDGTVLAIGKNDYGQCDVNDWTDIIAVSIGGSYTVGLKLDGTVVATGFNSQKQCDINNWSNIVAISTGYYHTVGLKSDGTVVVAGANFDGQCDVDDWTDIVAISAGKNHTVGLKSNGTVVVAGNTDISMGDIEGWTDIVAISAGDKHIVGLKSNGTVEAVGNNDDKQGNVDTWQDIVNVYANSNCTIGLKRDGTLEWVGNSPYSLLESNQLKEIVGFSLGEYHTVSFKSDGTLVATGSNYYGQCEVSDWTEIKKPQ